jgi:two-component system, NtrC family, response regulator HydG
MRTAPIPADEARRLEVLKSYDILYTPPEAAFDDIVLLAAQVCGAPVATVTLIDEHREWFKASVGLNLKEATREGFCSYTILDRCPLTVPDTHADSRFADNPYVTGPPHVRFYAGAPLITPDGPVIGTLCVIDFVPRQLTKEQGEALVRLARQVQTHLELRRALGVAHRAKEALHGIAHRTMDHEKALINLARECLEAHDQDEALRRLVQRSAETMGVDRANVWRINSRGHYVCAAHYQVSTREFSSGMEVDPAAYPVYFDELRRATLLVTDECQTDPRTAELVGWYLAPLGITSMLDSPVYAGGMLAGALCHEHVGPARRWTEDEKVFSIGVANLASLIFEQYERRRVERALESSEERRLLAEETARGRNSFGKLVGKSEPMQEVYRRIRLAAQSDVTVLVTGESGTGKELAASAIHSLGNRQGGPFVAVNCSAIPEALMESELFGHVKGAFTGAVRDKTGLFQAADGGTLFLDEVGDMSPALQVKVLRALQEREVRRVGDDRVSKVDVRVVTATNRDMARLVAAGKMREDFYYRIRVFDIAMPPLRDRRDDIPLLVSHFLAALSTSKGKTLQGVAPLALRALMSYDWPGNVRELYNSVEHATVLASGDTVTLMDLPLEVREFGDVDGGQEHREDEMGRRVRDALIQAGGSRAKAAKILGVSRVTLWKWMTRLGMVKEGQ